MSHHLRPPTLHRHRLRPARSRSSGVASLVVLLLIIALADVIAHWDLHVGVIVGVLLALGAGASTERKGQP